MSLSPCPDNTTEQVALNTAYLWGQGVKQVAISLSTAFAVTNDGLGYVWGGVNKWWRNTEYDPTAADTDKVCVLGALPGIHAALCAALKHTHARAHGRTCVHLRSSCGVFDACVPFCHCRV